MRWATVLLSLLLAVAAVALGAHWVLNTGAAAPTGNLTCSVKPACSAGEVQVFRMSNVTNAHAGTTAGSSYGQSVCCGEVCNLSTSCSNVHDAVVTLSGADNAHAAPDGSYGTEACLSVPYGVADCNYGPICAAGYACLATVSGAGNAHVADCDGDADDYATKVCCRVVDDCDNDSSLDPDDPDDDGDAFTDAIEAYLPTDSCDACPDVVGADDAWPLDMNMDTFVTMADVNRYYGRLGSTGGPPPSPMWIQRLDLNMDNWITMADVNKYYGKLGKKCT
jgi:hypothetical protein